MLKQILQWRNNECDGVSNHVIMMSYFIISPITLFFNQSLSIGIFPDQLKIANVIFLFKEDDPHQFDDYRPILLLPSMSKVKKLYSVNDMNIET